MNRRDFQRQLERILERSSRLRDWPATRAQLAEEIMQAHDTAVEDALEEYERAVDEYNVAESAEEPALSKRSSLECPEDVQFEEVSEG